MIKTLSIFILIFIFSMLPSYAIINGITASEEEFKNIHKVAFKYKGIEDVIIFWRPKRETPFCTATIIGDYTILTAAHCTSKAQKSYDLEILVNSVKLRVDKIIVRAEYQNKRDEWSKLYQKYHQMLKRSEELNTADRRQLEIYRKASLNAFLKLTSNDLAMIRTKEKIPAQLIRTKLNFSTKYIGENIVAIGFGRTHYSQSQKKYIYPKNPHYRIEKIAETSRGCIEIYSHSKDDQITSLGDSGGPLILEGTHEQIGILGGMVEYENEFSSIYSKLEGQRNFILQNIK